MEIPVVCEYFIATKNTKYLLMLLNINFFFKKKKTFNGSRTLSYLIDSSNLVTRKEIKCVTCWGDEAQTHNLILMTEETGFNGKRKCFLKSLVLATHFYRIFQSNESNLNSVF